MALMGDVKILKGEIIKLITQDIVSVTRCKDCKYFEPDEIIAPETGTCWEGERVRGFYDFCSRAVPVSNDLENYRRK